MFPRKRHGRRCARAFLFANEAGYEIRNPNNEIRRKSELRIPKAMRWHAWHPESRCERRVVGQAGVLFPLTPTLSLGERMDCRQSLDLSGRSEFNRSWT